MLIHPTPNSSNIAVILYDANELQLVVVFKNKDVYKYSDVPMELYDALAASTRSVGKTFNEIIRNRFNYERVLS